MSLFRENLKQELIYKDIRVKELVELTGINKHTLDHYLTENATEPSAEAAVKIAKALNVSVEYLVTGQEMEKMASIKNSVLDLVRQLNYLSEEDILFIGELVKKLQRR